MVLASWDIRINFPLISLWPCQIRMKLQHNKDFPNKQKGTAISISNKRTGFLLLSSVEKNLLIPTLLAPTADFQYSPEAVMIIVTFTKVYTQSTSAQKRLMLQPVTAHCT